MNRRRCPLCGRVFDVDPDTDHVTVFDRESRAAMMLCSDCSEAARHLIGSS